MASLSKLTSTKSLSGASGGKSRMFGKMGVQTSQPGVAAPASPPGHNTGMTKGGSSRMAGKSGVRTAEPGKVTVSKSGAGNNTDFSVHGGNTKMSGGKKATSALPK